MEPNSTPSPTTGPTASTLPKRSKIVALMLVIMGAISFFMIFFFGMLVVDAYQSHDEAFPILGYFLGVILLTIILFTLSGKLHKGKPWAGTATLMVFLLYIIGDGVTLVISSHPVILPALIFHITGIILTWLDKDNYKAFANAKKATRPTTS